MGLSRLARTTRVRAIALAASAGLLAFGVSGIGGGSALGAAARPSAAAVQGPTLKLIAAQKTITVGKFGKQGVFFDPGIWVASLGGPFQLDVKRASYSQPLTISQVIRSPNGSVVRHPLPAWVLDSWNGLRHFLHITIRNHKGKIVAASNMTFCPAGYQLARTNPGSVRTDNYPLQCSAFDPFSIGEVWGLPRGWAVDPSFFVQYNGLHLGTYFYTESIGPAYAHLFRIPAKDTSVTVKLKVVKARPCCGPFGCCAKARVPAHFVRVATASHRPGATHPALASLPAVPTLKNPPVSALPDLIPLPSWGISTMNVKKSGETYLDFGATVWVAGHAELDVEGFRSNGSNTMQAYQYFWQNGRVIGRAHVGTMGFSNYNAWHFKQFAQYKLLNAHKKVVVVSRKIGFCIAPTDGIDMLLRHALWQPLYTGISGNCGSPSALWVQELMPLGWGDTYFQSVPYQSFEVTDLPNGTYYIEIIANPEHLLHEVSATNDISLRKVIIGGTPGHRTVRVPAFHGIDPEPANGQFGVGAVPAPSPGA
ncbi:MAG TPA: lysyl oxidase family protein [Streptosporangiaceae bacterium]